MIDKKTVSELKNWSEKYVKTFRSANPEDQKNIELKEDHTRRVCKEILDIGKTLCLNEEDIYLAEVIALFHDIGRYEQYAHYRTFSDFKSEDHAMLGVKVLYETGILNSIDQSTRELILRTIGYHNRAEIPQDETQRCIFFTKLLRDADKLDIWRVVTDYYSQSNELRNEIIELGLPDTPEISDEVCAQLMEKRIVKMSSLKTLNDFKLLQMGWVYDVNFSRTFQLIRERGYLEMIRDALPQSEKVLNIYSGIESYLEKHCSFSLPNGFSFI